MASVTVPLRAQRRSLLGRIVAACGDGRAKRAADVMAAAAREHLPTLAGLGAVDYGSFRGSPVAGWIVLGVSVLLFDFKVRG